MTSPSRAAAAWEGDWARRLYEHVRGIGAESVSALGRLHPTSTFDELAQLLGDDVAPIQVEQLMRAEALQGNTLGRFARESFVRHFHEKLPGGWQTGERVEFQVAFLQGRWSSGLGSDFLEQARTVFRNLQSMSIPTGWIPAGVDDPLVQEAFRGLDFDRAVSAELELD